MIICLFGIILISCSKQDSIAEKPNIVLLVGDDQGYPYFGFMGADYVQTPNMDKLAASGIVFTQGYVPANHCRPSLQTLMTGTLPPQYEIEVQKLIREQEAVYAGFSEKEKRQWKREFRFHAMKYFKTLPRILTDHGYVSFQGGKWWEFNYQNGGFTEGMTTGWSEEDENKIESDIVKHDLIHSADIPATILDLIGADIPENYFGRSYKPVLEGKASGIRKEIIGAVTQIRWEGDMMGRKIDGYWLRNENWFFNWNSTDNTKALFDMKTDPLNNTNLAQKHPNLVNDFSTKIAAWKTKMKK
jgi:arylsulfatase A-like enzyme